MSKMNDFEEVFAIDDIITNTSFDSKFDFISNKLVIFTETERFFSLFTKKFNIQHSIYSDGNISNSFSFKILNKCTRSDVVLFFKL